MQKALTILGGQSSSNCIVEIIGNLDVGLDATLEFYPAIETCKNIVIRGQRTNQIQDAVVTITQSGPRDTWRSIQGSLTNLTASDYKSYLIENTSQNRTYVVRDNGASIIDTIAGNPSTNITSAEITVGVSLSETRQNAWYIGDTYELYKLSSSITFSGKLVVALKQLNVEFRDLQIIGGVNATWENPVTSTPLVLFVGCRVSTSSAVVNGDEPAGFSGSVMLNGVFVQGGVNGSHFSLFQNGACIKSESLWLNHTTITYMDTCYAFFMYGTNLQDDVAIVSSRFYGYGIEIDETVGLNGMRIVASTYFLHGLYIHRTQSASKYPCCYGTALYLDGGSIGTVHNMKLESLIPGAGFNPALFIQGAKLFARYGVEIRSTNRVIEMQTLSELIFFYETVQLERTTPGFAVLLSNSVLKFHVPTTNFTSVGDGMFVAQESLISFRPAPLYVNTTGPFVTLTQQARGIALIPPPTNVGGGSLLVLAAIGGVAWATINDLSVLGTQHCFFYQS